MPPSEYKVGQYYEWCTDIPLRDEYRESPSFFLYGTEWFLRLLLHRKGGYGWCFSVYLELRTEVDHYEPCYIKCEIGFKQEETLSLGKVEFEASEHREVWAIRSEDLQNALPYDYMTGNLMKLVLCFDDVTEPLLVQQRAGE